MKSVLSRLNSSIKTILLTVLIILLNIAAVFIFGLSDPSVENEYISPLFFIVSALLFFIHIPFCIICRANKNTILTKAIFFYQLIGVIAYIFFFAGYIAGQGSSNGLTAFFRIFDWWTVGYQDFMVMLSRFTGIPFKFTGGVLYLILTYFTASTYAATKKDIRYEENRRKEQEYIDMTKGRHQQ
ncbi:MAG: hypothetical protein J5850_06355 [Clostridia bacterium]|nr:hypothetical protein [Clostridia bacterium]